MATTIQELHPVLQTDTNLFLFLNNLGEERFDKFWLWITNKETWYIFYLMLTLFVVTQLKNWKKILIFILTAVAMITFIDQSTSGFFKPLFGRLRPCNEEYLDGLFRLVTPNCGGKYGFFSSHSSNSFATALFIGFQLRQYKAILWCLLAWASLIAYSRIYVGVHYPLDILVGAIWGVFFGFLFYRLYQFLEQKFT